MNSFANTKPAKLARLVAVAIGAVTLSGALSAQMVDPRWAPWLGCWAPQTAAPGSDGFGRSNSQLVCVTPASTGAGVNISTVIDGKTTATERLDVTGVKVTKTRDGCDGWEQATWALNAHRVAMRSEFTCAGGAVRKSSGIFAISPVGEFLQVHGIAVSGATGVRVALFDAARIDSIDGAPAYMPPTGFAAQTARLGASSEVLPADVLDMSKQVDAPVAEAWLTEVGQGFVLDGKSLVKLADSGLPPRMLDLMVALSNPKAFVVSKTGNRRAIDRLNTVANANLGNTRPFPLNAYGYLPIDIGLNGMYGLNSYQNGLGMGRFFGSYYGYNFNNFGWGSGFGYPYNYGIGGFAPPVVIVNRGDYEAPPRGRAVNGAGYTRGSGGSSGGASSRDAYPTYDRSAGARASAPSSSSGNGPSSGSSSSGGSSGGASSGSGERTAKPRPPGI